MGYYDQQPRYYQRRPNGDMVPIYDTTEYPGLCILLFAYAIFSSLYWYDLLGCFPRSGWHDLAVIAAPVLAVILRIIFVAIYRIPYVGKPICYAFAYPLIFSPFILDFYLMSRH
jgi:hypothetical protein